MFRDDLGKAAKFYERQLGSVAKTAIPHATRFTINGIAGAIREEYVEEARNKLVLRNNWTEKGARFTSTRSLQLDNMRAHVGSFRDYMADQEQGFTNTTKGKHGTPIPTSYAAGQGMHQRPRTKTVRKANRVGGVHLGQRGKLRGVSRKQQAAATVRMAAAKRERYVFLDLGKSKGLFRLHGSFKRPELRMVQSLSETTTTVQANPMLERASKRGLRAGPKLYVKALRFQLARLRQGGRG